MYSYNGFDRGQTGPISKGTLALNVPQLFLRAFGRMPNFDEAREIGMQFAALAASANTNGPLPAYWEDNATLTPSPAHTFLSKVGGTEISGKPLPKG